MLCFRCEHRAKFLEGKGKPRCECGDVTSSKIGCYMYKPCRPIILKKDKNDPRPAFGPALISARVYAEGLVEDCHLVLTKDHWLKWEEGKLED